MTRRSSLVSLANERVSILDVCRWIGMEVGEELVASRSSGKLHCPMGGIYHDDLGASRTFRIYPETNSAWCFRCHSYYTSVSLAAQAWGRKYNEVASELLDRIGYKFPSIADQWIEATNTLIAPDVQMLATALTIHCESLVDAWYEVQFDVAVANMLSKCFNLLEFVKTDKDADVWLQCVKSVMRAVIQESGGLTHGKLESTVR